MTEIEWETVEENLGMLTDETLDRFLKRIIEIKMARATIPKVSAETFR